MGTRADFYVGRGETAEWLGSIGWDGYPDGIPVDLKSATNEHDYRALVSAFAATRDDWTSPEQGWPWPWDDSSTTDYAYAYDDGKVFASTGETWFVATDEARNSDTSIGVIFPNMSAIKNVTFGQRSGAMFVSS